MQLFVFLLFHFIYMIRIIWIHKCTQNRCSDSQRHKETFIRIWLQANINTIYFKMPNAFVCIGSFRRSRVLFYIIDDKHKTCQNIDNANWFVFLGMVYLPCVNVGDASVKAKNWVNCNLSNKASLLFHFQYQLSRNYYKLL